MVVYTVLTTQIELGPAQHYQLVDMFMADPAMFIKYIGVMFETRAGVEDASWLFRGYVASQVQAGEWVRTEGCERLDPKDALLVARETMQTTILASLDSGINAAIMECSLHIFFREFCPTSEHAVFRHPITGFACGPVRVQLTYYQGHFRDKERARGI